MRPVDEQMARLRRGTAEIIVEAELIQKLQRARATGTPLKVKLGLDPTAPDLHLGHTVVLQKLRDFQDLGHQIIIIIGDFTGMIGDPTGRSETRRPLSWDEIRANAETYRAQLGKILEMTRTRVEFNSTWLSPLTFEGVIRETAHLTVAQMLQREDFASRYASGRPISLHEFLYPIAQAYDSVALGADVELGGTDQTFNLLVGRDLQRAHEQEPQVALTVPILEGLDGAQKMSKSLGNYVGIAEPAAEMFGKLMSVSDTLMFRYFELVTRISPEEIAGLRRLHPMEAKKRLARIVTAQYHGEAAAAEAEAEFVRVIQNRQAPEIIETVALVAEGEGIPVWKALTAAGIASSNSEARRKMGEGGVRVDGERVIDLERVLGRGSQVVLQLGRRFKRVLVK
ncbi:MAG: tyrosine--tRNA ligase [Candidatus Rokubacteria bacterium GWC2_70_24]|nr:MAG: tyrosine--tRNA ligase [Candidatus Rokubacteria bacterium GWA2_70_23]OGK93965.1 MAG: tyrosine--tRNA ligase [Candidatus Rokubacteria bacterium GWC2_70_24]